jgi:hypothetical protein
MYTKCREGRGVLSEWAEYRLEWLILVNMNINTGFQKGRGIF